MLCQPKQENKWKDLETMWIDEAKAVSIPQQEFAIGGDARSFKSAHTDVVPATLILRAASPSEKKDVIAMINDSEAKVAYDAKKRTFADAKRHGSHV